MVGSRVAGLAGSLVWLAACAGEPPAFPDGASGDDATGGASLGSGTGNVNDAEDGPDGATAGSSTAGAGSDAGGNDDASGSTADGSAPEGSSGAEPGSTGEPSGDEAAASTSGADLPWYVGHYEGVWNGSCESIPLSGNGTWSIDVDADGNITGTYDGNLSGTIMGDVDRQGNQTATADGPDLGECDWSGVIEQNGDTLGEFSCPYQCSGEWSGTLQ